MSVVKFCTFTGPRFPWLFICAAALGLCEWKSNGDSEWPRFRGVDGNGIAESASLPVRWSASEVRWKAPLPGKGHSSPVVWRDHLYVTSGNPANAERYLICLQAADGRQLWQRNFSSETFPQNRDNSFASSTPAVDDRGVYIYWTTPEAIQVAGVSHEGKELWRRALGPFTGKHGSGSSPVVMHGVVWVNNDQDGPSALLGLDAKSGETKHKIERRSDKVSYGTPCLFKREGEGEELIFAASAHGLTSVNPQNGNVNWDCTNLFPARVVSSPISSEGLIICSSGEGGTGRRLVAVRPPTRSAPAALVYDIKRGIPNVPTPLAKDGRLYLLCDNGLIQCVRTATGEQIWQEKISARFYGSPVWAQNRLYFTSQAGEVFVIAAGDKYELLAKNDLGEASFATPAIANGNLYFRTVSHVVAVGSLPE